MLNKIKKSIRNDNIQDTASFLSPQSASNSYLPVESGSAYMSASNTSFPTLQVGGEENRLSVESDGTLYLSGSATAWDDVLVTVNSIRVGGSQGTEPAVYGSYAYDTTRGNTYSGLFAYSFPYAANTWRDAFVTVQFPHTMKLNSRVYPHLHCRLDANDGNQVGNKLLLEIEYIWTNVFEAGKHVSATDNTNIVTFNHTITEANLDGDNCIIELPPGGLAKENSGISSLLEMRFSRIVKNVSWTYPAIGGETGLVNDNFNGTLWLKSFDVHFEVDSFGSREEYVK